VAHRRSNGQAERAHAEVLRGLKTSTFKKKLEACGKGWHDELQSVMWSIRTIATKPTGETPFFLVYGAEAILPHEVKHRTHGSWRLMRHSRTPCGGWTLSWERNTDVKPRSEQQDTSRRCDGTSVVVVEGAKGHRKADLPQVAGGAAADPGEGLGGAEPLEWYVKKAISLHREHVQTGATVDEGLGDSYVANGGHAKHWEHARANGGDSVIPRVEGEVGLGRRPTRGSSLPYRGGANLAKKRLGVTVRGRRLRAAEDGYYCERRMCHEARDEETTQLLPGGHRRCWQAKQARAWLAG